LSVKCFRKEFREFVPRNRMPSCFIFFGIFRKGIPSVCFYFCSTERNSKLFSLPSNGSERNNKSLLLFMFQGTVCFCLCFKVQNSEHFSPLQNGSQWNSESFLFSGTAGIPPEQNNLFVYFVFPRIIFVKNCQS
jgi:hypothetical protein